MNDDFHIFADPDDGEGPLDPDVAIMTAYLARELSPMQVLALEERLAIDPAFRSAMQPLISAWAAPVLSLAGDKPQRILSPTPAEIADGWQRFQLETPKQNSKTWPQRLLRIAAIIAVIVLPVIGVAQVIKYVASHPGLPGYEFARSLRAGPTTPSDTQGGQPLGATDNLPPQTDGTDPKGLQAPPTLVAERDLTIAGGSSGVESNWAIDVSKSGAVSLIRPGGSDRAVVISPDGKQVSIFANPGGMRLMVWHGWVGDSLWFANPAEGIVVVTQSQALAGSIKIPLVLSAGPGSLPASYSPKRPPQVWAVYPNGDLLVDGWELSNQGAIPLMVRVAADGKVKSTLGRWSLGYEACRVDDPDAGEIIRQFCRMPATARAASGDAMVTTIWNRKADSTAAFRVIRLDTKGDTVFTRSIPFVPLKTTAQELDSVVTYYRSLFTQTPTMQAALKQLAALASPVHAPVTQVIAGDDGSTWLKLVSSEPGNHWLILGLKGEIIGKVVFPASVQVRVGRLDMAWVYEELDAATKKFNFVRFTIKR